MENGIPRRARMDLWTPAEKAIYDALQVVEQAGGDVRLTKAVILLGEARDKVADFVEGVPDGEGYPRPVADTRIHKLEAALLRAHCDLRSLQTPGRGSVALSENAALGFDLEWERTVQR